jgi:predicted acetyltransferase
MKEVEEINEDIKYVYNEIINKYDYIAKRSEIQWKALIKSNYKFICYDRDQPVGYIFLHFPKKDTRWWEHLDHIESTIYIRETFWLNQLAKQTIFNFLWSHRDQRKYIAGAFPVNENIIGFLNNPRILTREIHPSSMLRIIDLKSILESLNYSISDFNISIRVHDKYCPWNNGNFLLASDNEVINVKFEENKEEPIDLEIDISHFAQLLVGYRTIDDLLEYNFAKINKEKLELIKRLFPIANSNFSDYF